MALAKEQTNSAGVVTNYHKIGTVNLRDNNLVCILNSYVSKEYRDLQRSVVSTNFLFNISVEEEESMGIRQLCYKKIKELPNWADAKDC